MKETWSAMRKIIAPIMFVALATTGLSVGVTSAANAVESAALPVFNTFDSGDTWASDWWGQTTTGAAWWVSANTAQNVDGSKALQLSGDDANKSFYLNKSGYKFTSSSKPTVSFDIDAAALDVAANKTITVNLSTGDPVYHPDWCATCYTNPTADVTKTVTLSANNQWTHVTVDFSTVSGWDSSETYKTLFITMGYGHHWIDNVSVNGGDSSAATPVFNTFDSGDTWASDWWGQTTTGAAWWVSANTAQNVDGSKALQLSGDDANKSFYLNKSGYKFTSSSKPTVSFDIDAAALDVAANKTITVNLSTGDPVYHPDWCATCYTNPTADVTKTVTLSANNQWTHVTVDFSTVSGWDARQAYKTLFITMGYGHHWIDNVSVNGGAPAPAPSASPSASPTPTVASIKLDDADLGPQALYSKGNQWWGGEGNGSRNIVKYLPAGGTWTFHYTVKDTAGNPVSGAQVTLASSEAADSATSGDRTKTTDANGKVTFTFSNSTSNANAEWPRPNNNVWSESESTSVGFNFVPYISGSDRHTNCYDAGNADSCNRDRLWGHVVSTATYFPCPKTELRLTYGDNTAATDKSGWWTDNPANRSMVKFVTAGNKVVFNYLVTEGGTPVGAGRTVTLVSDGSKGGATFTGSLTATTNANGIARFTLTNTNVSGEARPVNPSTMNYWDNSRNNFGDEVSQNYNVSISNPTTPAVYFDRLWLHVVNKPSSQAVPAAPYAVNAKRSGAKQITVNWNAATEDGNANTGYEVTLTPKTGAAVVATAAPTATSLPVNVTVVTGYTASVKAINSAGKSAATAANEAITPSSAAPKAPNAPSFVGITKGVDALWLTFAPSVTENGATSSGFQYTLDNGQNWRAVTYDNSKPGKVLFLYNLDPGTTYSVKLRALNEAGISPASTAYSASTATAPTGRPTLGTVSYVGTTLSIGFTGIPAAGNGGTTITSYWYSLNNGGAWIKMTNSQLTSGVVTVPNVAASNAPFTVVVKGNNGADSAPSTAKVVSTIATAPNFTVTGAVGKVVLSVTALTATTNTSNSPVVKYQYTKDNGVTWIDIVSTSATNITAAKGTTVSVKVRAVNSVGAGAASAAKSAAAR